MPELLFNRVAPLQSHSHSPMQRMQNGHTFVRSWGLRQGESLIAVSCNLCVCIEIEIYAWQIFNLILSESTDKYHLVLFVIPCRVRCASVDRIYIHVKYILQTCWTTLTRWFELRLTGLARYENVHAKLKFLLDTILHSQRLSYSFHKIFPEILENIVKNQILIQFAQFRNSIHSKDRKNSLNSKSKRELCIMCWIHSGGQFKWFGFCGFGWVKLGTHDIVNCLSFWMCDSKFENYVHTVQQTIASILWA